jgi:hypothetical protein
VGNDLLAAALVWSIILALLLSDHVQRRETWYAALDAWFETTAEEES